MAPFLLRDMLQAADNYETGMNGRCGLGSELNYLSSCGHHCYDSVMSVAHLSTQHRHLCLGKPRVWVAACCKLLSRSNSSSTAQAVFCSHSARCSMSPEPQDVRQAPLPQLLSVAPM